VSEPAKDEAELMERVVATLWRYQGAHHAEIAFAAIRAAGWAVVPVALIEKAASDLVWMYNQSMYGDDLDEALELPDTLRAMIAAAPGVRP